MKFSFAGRSLLERHVAVDSARNIDLKPLDNPCDASDASDLHGRLDSKDARIGNRRLFVLCEFTADGRTVTVFSASKSSKTRAAMRKRSSRRCRQERQ
jgi:hypothetical protein